MPVSDTLKKFRSGGYGSKPESKKPEDSSGPRSFKLTDEEAKEIQGTYQDGMEAKCEVMGRLGANGEFIVTSVHLPGGEGEMDMNAGAEEVMSKMRGPVTPMQTIPSPS